jgi:hypothetical protein
MMRVVFYPTHVFDGLSKGEQSIVKNHQFSRQIGLKKLLYFGAEVRNGRKAHHSPPLSHSNPRNPLAGVSVLDSQAPASFENK